jgi:enamine deaminase RidA (YjgF/YER057c/UK114 family)
MAPKQPVLTTQAPPPLPGIYSQAIVANGVIYCSGQVGMDPVTKKIVEGDVKARTVCTLNTIRMELRRRKRRPSSLLIPSYMHSLSLSFFLHPSFLSAE